MLLAKSDFRCFIEYVAPHIEYPNHLQSYIDSLLLTLEQPIKRCLSAPPRHGKSETTALFLAWVLFRDPTRKICYATYGEKLSVDMSQKVRDYYVQAGGEVSKSRSSVLNWQTNAGGGLDTTSVNTGRTGRGYHIIIVDDPVSGRADAESAAMRDQVRNWFRGTMATRTEGKALGGTSIIVMATRWHREDLIGSLIESGWTWINIPALDESGAALWPRMFDREYFEEFRRENGEYEFYAQFMGQPRSKGIEVFRTEALTKGRYDTNPPPGTPGVKANGLPLAGHVTMGIDFAYTSNRHSDYSAAVVLYHALDGSIYVADVWRGRCDPTTAKQAFMALHAKHGEAATIYSCITATERGMLEFLRNDRNGTTGRLNVVELPANKVSGDKFARAQPVAAAVNAGRFLLPAQKADWHDAFVSELANFTGLGDAHDDQVDALAAAFYPYQRRSHSRWVEDDTFFTFG